MAQILKDESRIKILDSAKEEFLEKGFEGASMRDIAKKSGMTVGNLYRYFRNKEDINDQIVSGTLSKIDEILKDLTSDNVSMEARVFNIKADVSQLSRLLDELSYRLVDTYNEHPIEFNILMMNSDLHDQITRWFSKAISSLIDQHFIMDGRSRQKQLLSDAYAVSIFTGIKDIFLNSSDVDEDVLKQTVSTYLHSFIILLDSDIHRTV